jgi:type IV fimbrial biogenesis protein FimT
MSDLQSQIATQAPEYRCLRFLPQAGFTIIEMMVTVVVASVLMAVAVPSMRNIIIGNRLTAQTNTLVATLQLARSEAIKRATPISVAPLGSSSSATDWNVKGWQVFIDADGDGVLDSGEVVLSQTAATSADATYPKVTVSTSPLTYRANGSASTALTAKVCNTLYKSTKNERQVSVTVVGTVQTTETTNSACT